jgi:hypothetical protein
MQAKWTAGSTGMVKMWIQKNNGGYTEVMNYTGPTWLDKYNDKTGTTGCQITSYVDANGIGLEPLAPNWQVGMYYSNDAPLYTNPRVLYADELAMNRTLCSTSYGSEAWNLTVPAPGALNGGVPGTATVTEMEGRSYTQNTGDTNTLITDAAASAGQYVKFNANAVNDSVQTGISVTTAGTYNVKLQAKKFTSRGTADLYVNNNRIGSWDQYGTSAFAEKDLGNIALLSGSNTFKWVITGKNASSTGYDYTFDKITVTVP